MIVAARFLSVLLRFGVLDIRMIMPWPFSFGRTIWLIAFDLAMIALVGFVLFSGFVI